ncbi:MAG: SPOR domain-containing protein [Sphingomonadales bacterium]|jgi:D-alanyl-D-alanine carboxypeptidase|nr:SPOR domain-containing protein [Sphingomonadales bacterium]MBK9268968.1 SPOR domain-containing protein [Sphingomonadales bacterium]
MKNKTLVKLALSTAVVGFTALGGAGVVASSAATHASADVQAKKAHGWAKKAEALFAKGKTEKALGFAEAAVEADLTNLEYRSLLARIYMAQGRFVAAERTFMDVMELGQVDARTVVGVALTRTAQGKVESAISLVDAHRSILPASDYGLALALAGDSKRSIDVLVEAIRADNASSRTRQNLALAYALDGRWRDARVMALQDLPQNSADMRIAEWVQIARPGAYLPRVASLLKVTPREDAGQPVRLALGGAAMAPIMAAAEPETPVAVAAAEPAAFSELAAVGPAPVAAGYEEADVRIAAAVASVGETEAPLIKAPETPAKSVEAAPAPKPVKLALADTSSESPKPAGKFLVQLGAFSSAGNAQKAWNQYTRKHKILNGFSSASSTVNIKGKTLTRLAASGFGNYQAAAAACSQIKKAGGDCVVKTVGGSAPVRMAAKPARKPVKIAAR